MFMTDNGKTDGQTLLIIDMSQTSYWMSNEINLLGVVRGVG